MQAGTTERGEGAQPPADGRPWGTAAGGGPNSSHPRATLDQALGTTALRGSERPPGYSERSTRLGEIAIYSTRIQTKCLGAKSCAELTAMCGDTKQARLGLTVQLRPPITAVLPPAFCGEPLASHQRPAPPLPPALSSYTCSQKTARGLCTRVPSAPGRRSANIFEVNWSFKSLGS